MIRATYRIHLAAFVLTLPGMIVAPPMLHMAWGDDRTGPEFDLEEPIRAYLGLTETPVRVDGRLSTDVADKLAPYDPIVLIATVPDPIDSSQGYRFDFVYGAIQAAIEEVDFSPDRFKLPWPSGSSGAGPPGVDEGRGGIEEAPARLRGAAEKARPQLHRRWPGLVVFRQRSSPRAGQPPRERVLLLLLIGETSTWGIQKEAFREALMFRATLFGRRHSSAGAVHVLGPYFTGSAASLRMAIGRWLDPEAALHNNRFLRWLDPKAAPHDDRFLLYSGSATGLDAGAFAELPQVTFHTTVHSDFILLEKLLKFIEGQDRFAPTPPRIAVMAPLETDQGRNVRTKIERLRKVGDVSRKILFLPLPLHLSHAWDSHLLDDPNRVLAEVSAQGLIARRAAQIEPRRGAEDAVPPLSRTPEIIGSGEWLLLAKALAVISREDIRYVGIVSTDAREKIFLTLLITRFCPDVQIFFTANDMMLTFPKFGDYLEGAIVASTYPMFSPSQVWDFPYGGHRERRTFSSEYDQGYYNAALLLIDGAAPGMSAAGKLLDYGPPNPLLPKTGVGGDAAQVSPPVWVSIIGNHGPWPIAAYKVPGDDYEDPIHRVQPPLTWAEGQTPAGRDDARARFTIPWVLLFASASLVALLFCCAYVWAFPRKRDSSDTLPKWYGVTLAVIEYFRPIPAADARRSQKRFILRLFLTMLIAYSLVARPGFAPLFDAGYTLLNAGDALPPMWWSGGAMAIITLIICLAVAIGMRWKYPEWSASPWYVQAGYRLLLAVPAAVALWFYHDVLALVIPLVAMLTMGFMLLILCLNCWDFPPLQKEPFWYLKPWRSSGNEPAKQMNPAQWSFWLACLGLVMWLCFASPGWVSLYLYLRDLRDLREPWAFQSAVHFGFRRTVNLGSGISPTGATLLLGAALMCWPLYHLRRLRLNNAFQLNCPFAPLMGDPEDAYRDRLERLHESIINTVEYPCRSAFLKPLPLAVATGSLVFLAFMAYRTIPTVEGPVFSLAAFIALVFGPFFYVFVLLHTHRLVGEYRQILRQLAMAPMAAAYERLPQKASFTYGRLLSMFTPRVSNLRLAVQQYDALVNDPKFSGSAGLAGSSSDKAVKLHRWLEDKKIREQYETELQDEDDPHRITERSLTPDETAKTSYEAILRDSIAASLLTEAAQRGVTLLTPLWRRQSVAEGFVDAEMLRARKDGERPRAPREGGHESDSRGWPLETGPAGWIWRVEELNAGPEFAEEIRVTMAGYESDGGPGAAPREAPRAVMEAAPGPDLSGGLTAWLARAEELVALMTITYVSQFALHLRNNVMFLTACPLLMLVAVNAYPLQPHRLLALFFWTLSLATLLIVIALMVTLDRDELLSRIAKARPAHIDLSSMSTVAKYVVPLIGVLITQHPDVSDFLYSYLGPLLRVIEK